MEIQIRHNRFTLLSKIYVWSVVLELLLFFVLADRNVMGVGGNISRLLQFFVLIGLGVKALMHFDLIRLPNLLNPLYRTYSLYLLFAISAGSYGFFSGAYSLEVKSYTDSGSIINQVLNGPWLRPLFEYFIALYYFLYFVVLPGYLLSNIEGINYFFKVFCAIFFVSFLIGVIDLLLQYFIGYEGVPRHIYDGRSVGFRFHGLAGEPRDAFVYLIMGLGIFALRDIWRREKTLNFLLIVSISSAAILTQSASGIIGLVLAIFLIMIFYIPKVSPNKFILGFFLIGLMATVTTVASFNSIRLLAYINAFNDLYDVLESNQEVTSILRVAMNNIYPIWQRWLEVLEFNFLPLIIGTGFGSASVINNNFLHSNELLNPNANIIRSLYETGVVGTYLLIITFLVPIKKLALSKRVYYKLTLLVLLLIGTFLAHRSAAPFILLGITIVVLKQQRELRQISTAIAGMKRK